MTQLLSNKNFQYWFAGFALITTLLWIFVLRFPGYIYYWDLSGAFSFRAPFEQYFSTYTPYDGVEVGLKNRIPVVSFIWLLTQIFRIFGSPEGEIAVKVAVWLMFVGAYTAFFFVVSKFEELFARKQAVLERTTTMLPLFRLLASLFYVIIPFYSYRITHLHLFYFTAFYPLVIYTYLRLLQSEKKDWFKWAALVTLTLFFGITSPHSVLYYAVTMFVLTLATWSKYEWSFKTVLAHFLRIGATALLVLGISLYWIVPYLMEGSPAPGYVVNSDTIEFLSQNSTLTNYVADASEWFLGQKSGLGVFMTGSPYITLQYVGLASLYGFAVYYLFSRFKATPYVRWILLLLLATCVIGVKDFPGFSWIYDNLSYGTFGWVIREPNRIRFIWSFWVYTFAVLGFYRYIWSYSYIVHKTLTSISTWAMILVTLVSYGYYSIPVFSTYLSQLKPVRISHSFVEVQNALKSKQSWGGVLTYPRLGGYGISWKEPHFTIADETEYLFLPYNLPVPPVQRASVLASGQSLADAVGQEYLEKKTTLSAETLKQLGIQYLLIFKDLTPLASGIPRVDNLSKDAMSFLSSQPSIQLMLSNSQYALYRVVVADDKAIQVGKAVHTMESRSIYNYVGLNGNMLIRETEPNSKATLLNSSIILTYDDNENGYLDYLPESERTLYLIDTYSRVFRHASNVSWGRMSLVNKVNGEARNIFKNVGVYTLDTDVSDKVIYSDSPAYKGSAEALTIPFVPACQTDCVLYVKLLRNTVGGEIGFQLNNQTEAIIDSKYLRDTYQWMRVAEIQSVQPDTNKLVIRNHGGFQSIAQLILLPKRVVEVELLKWDSRNVEKITYGASITLEPSSSCSVNEAKKTGALGWDVRLNCTEPVVMKLPGVWNDANVFLIDRGGHGSMINPYEEKPLSIDGTIYLVTDSTIVLWSLVILDAIIAGNLVAYVVRSKRS